MATHYSQLSKILKNLLGKREIKPADLARGVDLPLSTIHRIVTGKSTRPHASSLELIADYFELEVSQLLGEKPMPGEQEMELSGINIKKIPLVSWNDLINAEKSNFLYIPFIGNISNQGFATVMPDTSMSPFIRKNSVLIFDPNIEPFDRSCVLVKIEGANNYVVRELLIDIKHKYLKPLNPDLSTFKMQLLEDKDVIVACLIESRHQFLPEEADKALEKK